MDLVFYMEFDKLLEDYSNPTTREEKLIKHKLDSIVNLYRECGPEERDFVDEIMLEFSRIMAIVKNQYQKEVITLMQENDALKNRLQASTVLASDTPASANESAYEYDIDVLAAFYDYFSADYPLAYWEIEGYSFESNEERKEKVNLTIWDYVNRIKTFCNKYLYEIYPEDSIPYVIHGETADEYETFEPIVFVYNNLEIILAKIKTTNENGETVKQRLNIRSALRKLNEFKQAVEVRG